MKTNRSLFSILAIAFGALLCYMGCSKQNLANANYTVNDHTLADEAYSDMFRLVCQKAWVAGFKDSCYTVTASGAATSPTYTFSFVSDCTDKYGKIRKGSMTIAFSKSFDSVGAVVTVTPGSDYSFNDCQVQGAMTVTNKGLDGKGRVVYEMVVANSTISRPYFNAFTWSCDEFLSRRYHDALVFNDNYSIKGMAKGIDRNAYAFVDSINDSLQKGITCNWPFKGISTFTITGLATKVVTYGPTTSDSLSCNGIVYLNTNGGGTNSVTLN